MLLEICHHRPNRLRKLSCAISIAAWLSVPFFPASAFALSFEAPQTPAQTAPAQTTPPQQNPPQQQTPPQQQQNPPQPQQPNNPFQSVPEAPGSKPAQPAPPTAAPTPNGIQESKTATVGENIVEAVEFRGQEKFLKTLFVH